MTLDSQLPRRFVKHVVRRVPLTAVVADTLAPRDVSALHRRATKEKDNTGLDPLVVVGVVGGLLALFLIFLLIGGICKLANRPRSEARHDVYSKAMFQPSAAGYGVRGGAKEGTPDLSSANLLGGASPMGQGGQYSDADTSAGGSSDSAHNTRTHTRGKSSGVNLPGPPAAFRRGGGQQHPQVGQYALTMDAPAAGPSFSDAAPDGSGFRPGQVFDYGALNGGAPRQPTGAPNGYAPRQGSLRPANRGPPPALSRSRSGRYAQGADARRSRIDSVGPGTIRRSMYLPEEGGRKSIFLTNEGQAAYNGLRRVDSVGKGDPRRKSVMPMDVGRNEMVAARADGWGAGTGPSMVGGAGMGMDPLAPGYPARMQAVGSRQIV